MDAGFYRFDVHFFDGAEQNAHGFVYAENYANAVEKVCDMVDDEDIADIKIEGMEPSEVLLMPDWIADKITKYDYFSSDYKPREDKNVQFKNVNSVLSAEKTDEVMKEIEKHLTNGNYGPSDKLPLSQQSIEYINECVKNGLPVEMPSHHGEE